MRIECECMTYTRAILRFRDGVAGRNCKLCSFAVFCGVMLKVTSGHEQRLISLRVDCDRDCLLAIVDQTGPACHTNRRSCYYTDITDGQETELSKPMV